MNPECNALHKYRPESRRNPSLSVNPAFARLARKVLFFLGSVAKTAGYPQTGNQQLTGGCATRAGLLACLALAACADAPQVPTPGLVAAAGEWSSQRAEIAADAQAKVEAALSCYGREDVVVHVVAKDLRGYRNPASADAHGVTDGYRLTAWSNLCVPGKGMLLYVHDGHLMAARTAAEEAAHAIQCADGETKVKDNLTLEREALAMTEVCGG